MARNNLVPLDVEYRIIRDDGILRFLHERCEFVLDDQGNLVRLEGFVADITDQKKAEEALRESEDSYRRQFSENFAVMLLIDPKDGRIFDAELSMKKYHKTIDWHKIEQGPLMDDVEDAREDHTKNNTD